ncbi:MAG: ABC transporter substrate-binding protein [Chloroflexi bacterium]|nr:ABC transporter substrate-binding protein [Chloroflexota bacterium]
MKSFLEKIVFILFAGSFLLTACGTQSPAPVTPPAATETPTKTPTAAPADLVRPLLRYAILSDVTTANVWALFDETGASYENYAVQGAYWPRLYGLSEQRYELTPVIADGFPSEFVQEGKFVTATVSLLPGLTWSDGGDLTAADVAFTVNTALTFRLGLNWRDYYNPDFLDHVEALDAQTVKYYFRQTPGLAAWQYGALLGVIVSETYWEAKIAGAAALLPSADEQAEIADFESQIAALQSEVDSLTSSLAYLEPKSDEYRAQNSMLQDRQSRMDSLKAKLSVAQNNERIKLAEARAALYQLDNEGEPTLGAWLPGQREAGAFTENVGGSGYPFDQPSFDRVRYTVYAPQDAVQALLDNEVDFILTPAGLSQDAVAQLSSNPEITIIQNRRSDIRYLAFNHARPHLADRALRQAIACAIDAEFLARTVLRGKVQPAYSWVLPENNSWYNADASLPCQGLDAQVRLSESVRILKEAGYVWDVEPAQGVVGRGLKTPDGTDFPALVLLAPDAASDPSRAAAAAYVDEVVRFLGIPLTMELVTNDDLFFAVYGVGAYDMAILGWSLGLYPDYLCTFFDQTNGNPYHYVNGTLETRCDAFLAETDMARARAQAMEIQALLNDDLPAIPLFSDAVFEAYRNLEFPYTAVLDGIGPGLYGAPILVMPSGG